MSTALVKRTHFPSRESTLASHLAVRTLYCLAKGFERLAFSQTTVASLWFYYAARFGTSTVAVSLADKIKRIEAWKEYCGAKA